MLDPSVPQAASVRFGYFPTTHWSVIRAAGGPEGEPAREALCRLCEVYRPPLLSFARTVGLSSPDAEDITQGFFAQLLRKGFFAGVHQREGVRFRSFFLRCFRNFIADERARAHALKRGGGMTMTSLDARAEEGGLGAEPADVQNAVRVYEREWAITLLHEVFNRLEAEYRARGRGRLYDRLSPLLLDRRGEHRHADLAIALGRTPDAVRQEVFRMRRRYRELLREEVAHTVLCAAEIEEEIRYLFSVLSG